MIRTLLFLFLFSTSAIASPTAYQLQLSLELDGETLFTSQVSVLSEKTVTIKNSEYFLDITPVEQSTNNRQAVLLQFVVGKMHGSRRIIFSQPQILALESQKTEISVFESYGKKETLLISAIAERIPAPYFKSP